jgi:hypothetical protein
VLLHSSSVMLALKQALSLSSTKILGAWSPEQEASLVAWYQYQTGITLNGSDVSEWADYTGAYNMVQATAARQPAYSSGTLTFVLADTQFLQTTGQITLAGDFTIGFRVEATGTLLGTVLGDNTTANEFMRFNGVNSFRVNIDGNAQSFVINTTGENYYVLTRSGTTVTIHQNGVALSPTRTYSGTADIDTIGDSNSSAAFNGTMKEIQIYSSTSAALTANVNSRLAGL